MLGGGTRKFYKKYRIRLSIGADFDNYGVHNGVSVRERMIDAMQPRLPNS